MSVLSSGNPDKRASTFFDAKKPSSLQLKSRQAVFVDKLHFRIEIQSISNSGGRIVRQRFPLWITEAGDWFDLNQHVLHRSNGPDFNAEFRDVIELSQDCLDAGREHVVATDRQHVVRPTKDAATQTQ